VSNKELKELKELKKLKELKTLGDEEMSNKELRTNVLLLKSLLL